VAPNLGLAQAKFTNRTTQHGSPVNFAVRFWLLSRCLCLSSLAKRDFPCAGLDSENYPSDGGTALFIQRL